jgi:small subunit ribosomal protein S16
MAVKIRLARRGRKKKALYDVVVADARAPRDGRFIEKLGTYNPNTDPATINLNDDKAFDWVMKGAQPTDTVRAMLSHRGVMLKKHLQIGVLKGAISQEDADKRHGEWIKDKELKIQSKVDTLAKVKSSAQKERLEAEIKVNKARQEEIQKKRIAADESLAAEVAEANADKSEKALEEEGKEAVAEIESAEAATEEIKPEEVTPEAPAEEAKTEEVPAEEAPVEEAKAVETPAEEAPTEEAKAEETPIEEAPAEDSESKEDPKS